MIYEEGKKRYKLMKLKYWFAIDVLLMAMLFSACENKEETHQNNTIPFIRKIASEMNDETGWYFQFFYEASRENPSERVYAFRGINLRYRYHEDYWSVDYQQDQDQEGKPIYEQIRYKAGSLMFGEGGEAQQRDRKIMRQIMNNARTPQELLAENPDNYSFETIDKDMFFRLMKKALSGSEAPWGDNEAYGYLPEWSVKVEPEYLDGYKLQIIFVMNNNFVSEVYIDVLYKTGENYNDYNQLSDLIDAGEATQQQTEAFSLISSARQKIKAENCFIAGIESYRNQNVGGIDFSRLAAFLEAIHENRASGIYTDESEHAPFFTEEISEEEFKAAQLN